MLITCLYLYNVKKIYLVWCTCVATEHKRSSGDYTTNQSCRLYESAFIPFVSFGDLDNNTFKGLISLLSVEQEIQYDEHT
jgi:hypothetical protein